MTATLDRRAFLGAAGGLVIGFSLPIKRRPFLAEAAPAEAAAINAFLRIAPDDTVTILLNHSEMGQGVWTTLPMLLAEELEADWSKVRVEHAPVAPAYYHLVWKQQGTGGSSSTRSEFDRMRQVGASARQMLIAAAAKRWKVDAKSLRADNGFVVRGTQRLSFGALAAAAAKLDPPRDVPLKDPKTWKIIGKSQKRLDSPEKITGKAEFGLDVKVPGLLTAVVDRPPVFGGKMKSFDAAAALRVPGVRKVFAVPSGVAVVADHFWAASRGRDALKVEWDLGPGSAADTDKILDDLRAAATRSGTVALEAGDIGGALKAATTRVEAQYEVPYLAHAPMEPLNATVRIENDRCDVWTGTQFQSGDQAVAAEISGLPPDKVYVHTTFLGGGFGRRANPESDFTAEATHVAKGAGAPVKTVWSRADDLRGGWYRPMFVHRIEAGVDASGRIVAWRQTIAGQPLGQPKGIDRSAIEGVSDSPYLAAVPAKLVTVHSPPTPIPVLWWRSVGHTHTGFAMESFIDEVAHAVKRDPVELRLDLYKDHEGRRRLLEIAAERAGWATRPSAGVGRGVAVHESFGSTVAQIVDLSIDKGRIRVHKVVCAIDCGTAVNPDGVTAQMQSGIIYGLTAALYGQIRIKEGRVLETNFHEYKMVRMPEAPRVEVIVAASGGKMGGVGEPGTPPIAPAVANAIHTLSGRRLRTLPFKVTA